jgi:hypothetical protein
VLHEAVPTQKFPVGTDFARFVPKLNESLASSKTLIVIEYLKGCYPGRFLGGRRIACTKTRPQIRSPSN